MSGESSAASSGESSGEEAGMLRAAIVARAALPAARPFELLRLALKRQSISFFRPRALKPSLSMESVQIHGARGAVWRAAPLIAANTVAGGVLFKTHGLVATALEDMGAGVHVGTAALAGGAGGAAHALVVVPLQAALLRSAVPLAAALPVALARDALGFAAFFAGWSGMQSACEKALASRPSSSRPLELAAAVAAGGVAGGAYQFIAHPFEGKASLGEVRHALKSGLQTVARSAASASRPAVLVGSATFFAVEVLRAWLDALDGRKRRVRRFDSWE